MKLPALAPCVSTLLVTFCLAGCASTPKTDATALTAGTLARGPKEASASEADERSGAERWADEQAKKDAEREAREMRESKKGSTALDPLETGGEIEESSIPNVTLTPSGKLRAKTLGDLRAALGMVRETGTLEAAVKTFSDRLGPPTWVESPKGSDNAKRRVWVSASGSRCHRLVLEPDGAMEIDSASKTEPRMLSASARQNPCTGEITRGLSAQ
jgi:hypothetical protein